MLQHSCLIFLLLGLAAVSSASHSTVLFGNLTSRSNRGPLRKDKWHYTLADKIYSIVHPGQWFFTDFSISDEIPKCFVAAHECPNVNITFWLYTRETQNYPMELDIRRPITFKKIPYIKGAPWKIIVHGYTLDRKTIPNTQLRNSYFTDGEYNIITVDYCYLAHGPCYLLGVMNIPVVANCTAQILDQLIDMNIMPRDHFHALGHSLGTHVAGMIGRYLKSGSLPHLTALEPAILIVAQDPIEALKFLDKPSSADFVDVIHTDAGFLGVSTPVGHVDFWVNAGANQPYCAPYTPPLFSIDNCRHYTAVYYYCEAITSTKGFYGFPCNSAGDFRSQRCHANQTNQIIMGPNVPRSARGNYYVLANPLPPFAAGKIPPMWNN